jgi:hypothetical protein
VKQRKEVTSDLMLCLQFTFKFAVGLLISAGAVHVAALAAGVADRGFGAALACALSLYVASIFIYLPVGFFMGCFFPLWLFIVFVVVVTIYIIQSIYITSILKAMFMWLVMCVAYIGIELLLNGGTILRILNATPAPSSGGV